MNSYPGAWAAGMSASLISATTRIPAAQPIWGSSPTASPAMFLSARPPHSRKNIPACRPPSALTQPQMLSAAAGGSLGALLIVGANPLEIGTLDLASLKNTFIVVQDLFLTETAAAADVVFPAASLYEKTGTVTNTYGDLQLVRKAADKRRREAGF